VKQIERLRDNSYDPSIIEIETKGKKRNKMKEGKNVKT